jgi:DNA repair ATPase RecN
MDYYFELIKSIGTANLAVILITSYLVFDKIWSKLPDDAKSKITNILIDFVDKRFGISINKKDNKINDMAIEALESRFELSDAHIEWLKKQAGKIETMQSQIDELKQLKVAQKELLSILKAQEKKIASQEEIIKEMDATIKDIIKQRDDAVKETKAYAKKVKQLEQKHAEEIACYTERVEMLEKELNQMKSTWNLVSDEIRKFLTIDDADAEQLLKTLNKISNQLGL